MKNKSSRGEAVTIIVVVLGILGASQLVPNWRVSHWFAKKPPMIALADAQAQAAKAKAEADAKEAALVAAQATERAKFAEQVRSAQQTNEGAVAALRRVAAEHQVAEVKLGLAMTTRTSIRLAAAVGKLPTELQDEILVIVDQALSDKQAEVDAANSKLAVKDKEFTALTAERDQIKAQIPILSKQAEDAKAKEAAKDAVVATKTQEVVTYANKAAEKEHEAGSLGALVNQLVKGVVALVVLCIIFAGLWLYVKIFGVGTGTIGRIVADIRSGVDAIHAIDTNVDQRLHAKVKKIADSITPTTKPETKATT